LQKGEGCWVDEPRQASGVDPWGREKKFRACRIGCELRSRLAGTTVNTEHTDHEQGTIAWPSIANELIEY
jgi:hypothetical protein